VPGPPLPPTFQIEIVKVRPLPPTNGPHVGSDEAVNNTDGCGEYVFTATYGTSGSVGVQLGGSGAVASLVPAAVNSDAIS